ncbi:MAG: hypothetical protein J6S28_06190 [Clostridia bacterium]|nr:hypothetical protein [Clostridia bacterium]
MSKKIVRINSIITAVILFLYAGLGLLNVLLRLLSGIARITLPTGVMLCLAVLLPTVVLLIFGIMQTKKKQGKADLIFSIPTLIVSIIWIIFAVLNWIIALFGNVITEIYYKMDIGVPLGDLISFISYLNIAYMMLTTVIALYLLAVFIIRVLCAKQRWLQIKAELHKPAAALLILVPNLLSLIQTLLHPIFNRMGMDILVMFAEIYSIASFVITTALTLALAVFVLVFGLIIKKQPAAKVQEPEPASEQKQSADLPFNVPAGVSTDDL